MEFRIRKYKIFKKGDKRIMVVTNLGSRGVDFERVNLVFNYDMTESSDTYLHRVIILSRTYIYKILRLAEQADLEPKALQSVSSRARKTRKS